METEGEALQGKWEGGPCQAVNTPTDPTAEGSGPAESGGHSANMLEPRPPGSAAYQGVLDTGNK